MLKQKKRISIAFLFAAGHNRHLTSEVVIKQWTIAVAVANLAEKMGGRVIGRGGREGFGRCWNCRFGCNRRRSSLLRFLNQGLGKDRSKKMWMPRLLDVNWVAR